MQQGQAVVMSRYPLLIGVGDLVVDPDAGASLRPFDEPEQGGPELCDRFMDELREQHLGIPRPPGTPSVFAELQAAYEAAVTGGALESARPA